MIEVKNLMNDKGNLVVNQFSIRNGNFSYFQSYSTIIAKRNIKTDVITLDKKAWNYSKTTSKYLRIWLGIDRNKTEKLIKLKIIKIADLNK